MAEYGRPAETLVVRRQMQHQWACADGVRISHDSNQHAEDVLDSPLHPAILDLPHPVGKRPIRKDLADPTREVVSGVTLDLVAPHDQPVTITVSRDIEKVVESFDTFVNAFNDVLDRTAELTSFDPETEERGILQGDAAVRRIEERLLNAAIRSVDTGQATFNRLSSVGARIRGGRLQLDAETFRQALASDPEAVIHLFAEAENAFATQFKDMFSDVQFRDRVTWKFYSEMDHVAFLCEDRARLVSDIVGWVRDAFVEQPQ